MFIVVKQIDTLAWHYVFLMDVMLYILSIIFYITGSPD